MPDVRIAWRNVWFDRKAVDSSHSAAGALIVLLLSVYYSAQIVFFGAELTRAYSREAGSAEGQEGNRG
ncbi:MAG TPA: hypothetical protein VGF48_20375 [Thermoanaerobaculia bacterium]|jgi:membrane protein